MTNQGKGRLVQIFQKINLLERRKGTPLSLIEVAEEVNAGSDPIGTFELLEKMGLLEVEEENEEIKLTEFAKDVLDLPLAGEV